MVVFWSDRNCLTKLEYKRFLHPPLVNSAWRPPPRFFLAAQIEAEGALCGCRWLGHPVLFAPRFSSPCCTFIVKTVSAKPETVRRGWYVVDASDKVLGRLATEIARRLRGKHKPEYTPHVDTGDFIIVVNSDKVRVTGNKAAQKKYYHHTGYPGGIREITFEKQLAADSRKIIERAVKGMLPRNSLGRTMLSKLRVYPGPDHEHIAQQPQPLDI